MYPYLETIVNEKYKRGQESSGARGGVKYRAERAIEALKEMAAPTATVLQDGEELDISTRPSFGKLRSWP